MERDSYMLCVIVDLFLFDRQNLYYANYCKASGCDYLQRANHPIT